MGPYKALFRQCSLTGHGGGHGVAAWMLQALREDCEITLQTWKPIDFAAVNRAFGTTLRAEDFRILYPNPAARFLINRIPDESDFQRTNWLLRATKRMAPDFDVVLTGEDEVDFGIPGIQYVHYPYLAYHVNRTDEWRPWKSISGYSFPSMLQNLTLVNSHFTAEAFRISYGRTPEVLYPPAPGAFPSVAWEDRRDDFICLGRLEAPKNHDRILAILRRVREQHPHIRLRFIGSRANTAAGKKYADRLVRLAEAEPDWLSVHANVGRDELARLVAHARYGIHLLRYEHFGMAVAEMLRAGIIPFCHNSGGQIEISNQPNLIFDNDDHAVEIISNLLSSPASIQSTRSKLEPRRELFSAETFCTRLRATVRDFIESNGRVRAA